MSNIKEILQSLSRILLAAGFTPINAEDFRKAKFGSTDDNLTNSLWTLLIQILMYRDGRIPHPADTSQQEREKYLQIIKLYLISNGINICSSTQMSSTDLLVLVASLMLTTKLVDKISLSFMNSSLNKIPHKPTNTHQVDDRDPIDSLVILQKRSELSLRGVAVAHRNLRRKIANLSLSNEKEDVVGKISFCLELFIGASFRNSLEVNNQIIDDLMLWHTKGDKIFWRWMETVLEMSSCCDSMGVEKFPEDLSRITSDMSVWRLMNLAELSFSFFPHFECVTSPGDSDQPALLQLGPSLPMPWPQAKEHCLVLRGVGRGSCGEFTAACGRMDDAMRGIVDSVVGLLKDLIVVWSQI